MVKSLRANKKWLGRTTKPITLPQTFTSGIKRSIELRALDVKWLWALPAQGTLLPFPADVSSRYLMAVTTILSVLPLALNKLTGWAVLWISFNNLKNSSLYRISLLLDCLGSEVRHTPRYSTPRQSQENSSVFKFENNLTISFYR